MAIKELFYDNRPLVLLDPRASQRIDPRFTFTRDSIGSYVDESQARRIAGPNQPRLTHSYSGEALGLLCESAATNFVRYAEDLTNVLWVKSGLTVSKPTLLGPAGVRAYNMLTTTAFTNSFGFCRMATNGALPFSSPWVMSVDLKAGSTRYAMIYKQKRDSVSERWFLDLLTGTTYTHTYTSPRSQVRIEPQINGWFRVIATGIESTFGASDSVTVVPLDIQFPFMRGDGTPQYSGSGGASIYVDAWQFEAGTISTSFIPTGASAATRAADLLSVETPLPATGSIYIDARAISANENDTLLSLKNDSNDKIDLAYLSNTATYNSLALIANYDGVSKSSLPLPVPTNDRERNIITYGANNYQYGRDSSRFAPSLSSSVPTNLNKLSIGHDAVDPTKAFNGYINTVYAWSGELTREVAEALVRGEIDPINADTYSPTGPAGSLALVINTQGAAANGEKTFTLPAESDDTDNDIVITWGDGTESGLDGAAAELGAIGLTHDYPSAGIYPVWVEKKMQNIKYNNISNADDLLLIAAWGTGDTLTSPFTAPSTMNGAFYGCGQMDFSSSARNTNRPNTSAVTDWTNAFRDCSSITGTFPSFDFTAATTFSSTWRGCSSLASVPAIFVADGDVTQNVTSFGDAWRDCSSLTSFPLIDTSSGISFGGAWQSCNSLTSFPLINTSSGTNFSFAWNGCSSLNNIGVVPGATTSFPLINTSSGTSFSFAWYNCSSLTSFPLINTSSGISFGGAWQSCNSLTSFPLIDTSSGTSFSLAWRDCSSNIGVVFGATTSFPLIDTSSGTSFSDAWSGCSSLTSFPLINTSSGTTFSLAWNGCSSLNNIGVVPLLASR
jgi:hypothetical protein